MSNLLQSFVSAYLRLALILPMIGIGILTGCGIALACMTIAIIAAHPWLPIVGLAVVYGIIALAIEVGKL